MTTLLHWDTICLSRTGSHLSFQVQLGIGIPRAKEWSELCHDSLNAGVYEHTKLSLDCIKASWRTRTGVSCASTTVTRSSSDPLMVALLVGIRLVNPCGTSVMY